jgi:hypothetical protein
MKLVLTYYKVVSSSWTAQVLKMGAESKSETLAFTDLRATLFWKISFRKSAVKSSDLYYINKPT